MLSELASDTKQGSSCSSPSLEAPTIPKKQRKKMSQNTRHRPRRALSPAHDARPKRSSSVNGRSRLAVDTRDETVDNELQNQYDLTPVVSSAQDSRRPTTPSYSIDPWEVNVSPTSQGASIDSGKDQRIIVDRTPGDGADSSLHPRFDDDQGDEGYDPDVDEDDDIMGDASDQGPAIVDHHVDGVVRSGNPANRFLVPSDIRK